MFTDEEREMHRQVGERIRQARVARGWNQSELARVMGTSQSDVSEVECGLRGVRLGWLWTIAQELNVSLSHLLGVEPSDEARLSYREGYGDGLRDCVIALRRAQKEATDLQVAKALGETVRGIEAILKLREEGEL